MSILDRAELFTFGPAVWATMTQTKQTQEYIGILDGFDVYRNIATSLAPSPRDDTMFTH
jgi:hypothetical protein